MGLMSRLFGEPYATPWPPPTGRRVMPNWTIPICERCWISQEAIWEPTGNGEERLVGIRPPVRLIEPDVQVCGWCGAPTIFGVFKRADPSTVPYPPPETDDADT